MLILEFAFIHEYENRLLTGVSMTLTIIHPCNKVRDVEERLLR
jgi:hypothetical protein